MNKYIVLCKFALDLKAIIWEQQLSAASTLCCRANYYKVKKHKKMNATFFCYKWFDCSMPLTVKHAKDSKKPSRIDHNMEPELLDFQKLFQKIMTKFHYNLFLDLSQINITSVHLCDTLYNHQKKSQC